MTQYGLAIAGVVLVTLVRLPLESLLRGRAPYALYYLAILLAAWRGGTGPAIVATAASVAAVWWVMPVADIDFYVTVPLFLVVSALMALWARESVRLRERDEDARGHLAAVVRSTDDAIISKDLDGIIQSVNPAAVRLFGYTAEEMVGRPVLMLLPPDRKEEEVEILARLRRGERVDHFETVRMAKDGRRIDVSLTISPIHDRTGRIIGASKIARDITERKRVGAALAAQQEWLRVTLASIGDGVIASDCDGRITFLNPVAEQLTGWGNDAALGRPLADVFHIVNEHTRERVEQPSQRVIQTGVIVGLANHTLLIARDGTERPIADSAAPIRGSDGGIIGVVLVFRDASEHRRIEKEREAAAAERERLLGRERDARNEAERASRLKDEFAAMVSHELRTPLNAIVGWAQMLRGGKLDEATARKAVETIDRNAQAQSKLIADLLDLSRILSGKLSLDLQPVDLRAVVDDAVQAMKPAADAKGIGIAVAVTLDHEKVIGDHARLQQVVLNLLTNSIKFTPADGRIDVRVHRQGDDAVIAVRDTGKGIEPEFLPHVFDRFSQADSSTTRKYGGLGLGLAIVRHLVAQHGGTVRAQSEGPGRGATFTVTLPLVVAGDVRTAETPEAGDCVPDLLDGVRVLIVDDEPDTLELLVYSMERCGAEVLSASSVREALDIFRRTRPDVVVSDIGMPDQDGYDFIRAIRRLPPEEGGDVPAVAVTAFVGREDREAAIAAGFQEHLGKPVRPADLSTLLADLVRRQASSA